MRAATAVWDSVKRRGAAPIAVKRSAIALGVSLAFGYWMAQAAFDVWVLARGSFGERIFAADIQASWGRLLIAGGIAAAAVYLSGVVGERRNTAAALRLRTAQLTAVNDALTQMLQTRDWRRAGERILRSALDQTGAEFGVIAVVVDGPALRLLAYEALNPAAYSDFFERARRSEEARGPLETRDLDSLVGRCVTERMTILSNDPESDPRRGAAPPELPPLRRFLGLPLTRRAEVVGVIAVADRAVGFTGSEEARLALLSQAAGVLCDSYRQRQREESLVAAHAQTESALRTSELRLAEIIDVASDAIIVLDEAHRITLFNKSAEQAFGYSAAEVMRLPLEALLPQPMARRYREQLQALAAATASADGAAAGRIEIEGRRKDGSEFPAEVSISQCRHDNVITYTSIFRDVSENRRQAEALVYQATHDPLTSLPNRTLLRERLQQAITFRQREGRPLALLLIDLDRFKEINDTLGHHRGDLLLQELGRRLQGVLRDSDSIGRLGGDEFAILLPTADLQGAVRVVQKIQDALQPGFVIDGLPIYLEASIGVALSPEHGMNADTLFQRADVAMYRAKESGSGHAVYAAEHDRHSPRRLALMGELRAAIDHQQLVLHYQPKLHLASGRITGVEALVRWQHPQNGLIPPDQFIGPAERTGLIRPLTEWVLATALAELQNWHRRGRHLGLSVNLSVRNLLDPRLPDLVARLLQMHDVQPGALELEITESAIMADPARALEVLSRLTALGVRFSIDDFGTGYSSLGYLKRLPVGAIKIDKSFVLNMVDDPNDMMIVRSTIDLGRNLGLAVIAEGVETGETLSRLGALGCDAAQGFFVSRPLPAAELSDWLDRYRSAGFVPSA